MTKMMGLLERWAISAVTVAVAMSVSMNIIAGT